jgi:transposase-like protein
VAERVLEAELTSHRGYAKYDTAGKNTRKSRNGMSGKSVRCVHGKIDLEVPRDRNGTLEPRLVKKGEQQLQGFDDRIVSPYARGFEPADSTCH